MATTEKVEWQVGKREEDGQLIFTRDGAQSVFGLTRAKALAKKRGPEWSLFHWKTNLGPDAQAAFEAAHPGDAPKFGNQWGT